MICDAGKTYSVSQNIKNTHITNGCNQVFRLAFHPPQTALNADIVALYST